MQKKIRTNNIMAVLLAAALLLLAAPAMAGLLTPSVIDGYVMDSNSDPCNDPWVQVTNTNTSTSWYAENSSTSNYYRLVLDSDDVNAGEILRFDVTDGTSTNSTDHTMTDDEVNAGGLFDFNLTLESSIDPVPCLVTYTITNTTISPNGDGVMDDTEIDVEFSESVTAAIRIENASGVIKTLYTGSGVTDPDPQTWDGTDDNDNIVADGTYQVNITMDDGANPMVYNNTRSITVMPGIITSVSIPDVSATGMITVPITIENVSNAGSCQLTLNYDPDVVIVSSADHSDFDSMFANLEDAASGSVNILAYQTSNPGLYGNVVVANVIFRAVDRSGSSTPLDLEVTTLTDATPNCNPIPYTIRNGSFTTFLNGDVNGDSRVDVADCMYLAKHLLGVSGFETIVKDAADVNGNGEVEASDCMFLAKHLAGMDGFEVLK